MEENQKIKHLEFIQGTINRMNKNTFQLKGWTITIVSALLALYANKPNIYYLIIAIIPVIAFGFLDAFYLQMERKCRGLYNDVAGLSTKNNKQEIRAFDMPLNNYQKGIYSYWNAIHSKTIIIFYMSIIVILLALLFLVKSKMILF